MFRELTLAEAQQLEQALEAAAETFQMDEQTFRMLYERTARPLWSYLYRASGSASLADDLLQESYYRMLRVRLPEMNQDYMRNYLFRIGTNLLRDHWRRKKGEAAFTPRVEEENAAEQVPDAATAGEAIEMRSDLKRVLLLLKPRERELLWLAYVEGSSHREIAEIAGLKEQSIRPLLFRARQKLADLLRKRGFRPAREQA
jgi:RNA polymerase sigma-70 factor (ECF subfamily)